jgi:hypothetical protein
MWSKQSFVFSLVELHNCKIVITMASGKFERHVIIIIIIIYGYS